MFSAIETLVIDTSRYAYEADDAIPEPSGCAVCGRTGYYGNEHGWYWSKVLADQTGNGFHLWVAPSQEVRLLRMKARRDLRNQK